MRYATIAFLVLAYSVEAVPAGEAVPPPAPPGEEPATKDAQPPPTEMDLDRARLYAREGDMHAALLTTLRVLRDSLDEGLREGAKSRLRDWGLTPKELLTLDPTTLKPAYLNALCERAAKQQAIARRQELEIEYCDNLARAAVVIQRGHDGQFVAVLSEPDMARALSGLIKVAFSTPETEESENAQRRLERMGCVGAKLEAAQKTVAEGKLPEGIQNELLAAACLRRLRNYQEWLEEDNDEGDMLRRLVAQQLGHALFQYCDRKLKATAAYQRESETVGFWRAVARAPRRF